MAPSPDSAPTPALPEGGWRFEASYARLPEALFRRVLPTPVRRPALAILQPELTADLGLDGAALARPEHAGWFTGNVLPSGAWPLAQAYAGHQFGHFTRLGDGRAILLGEHRTCDGRLVDVQLKGAGPTPFSRGGDGRAALGPMLREYLVSEAMAALGIATSRALAVATTGEHVERDEPLPGAVLTRIAASHLRVGTFEYVSALGNPDLLRTLADYTLARHFADCAEAPEPYAALLTAVIERQAALIACWQQVGFVHGVMNTDNMALSGETLDYGPCAFLDAYDPATVFSSIDRQGRYSYGNQPTMAQWNLARFAECLLPLLDSDPARAVERAQEAVAGFGERYHHHWLTGMRGKLGLVTAEPEDIDLIESFLDRMHRERSDYTNTFRALCDGSLVSRPAFHAWLEAWGARRGRQPADAAGQGVLEAHNPAVIPRNHRVEEALDTASREGDFGPLHRLLAALAEPYDHRRPRAEYQEPSPPGERAYQTFCGT